MGVGTAVLDDLPVKDDALGFVDREGRSFDEVGEVGLENAKLSSASPLGAGSGVVEKPPHLALRKVRQKSPTLPGRRACRRPGPWPGARIASGLVRSQQGADEPVQALELGAKT